MNIDIDNLPNDPDLLKKLLLQQVALVNKQEVIIEKKQRLLDSLLESIQLEKAKRFAASSEKAPGQGDFFDEAESIAEIEKAEIVDDTVSSAESSPKQPRPTRKPLPEHLPREDRIVEIPMVDRQCECGCTRTEMGEDISEQLEIIPATVKVIRTRRKKYICKQCESGVSIAPLPPQMLPKSMVAPGLLAYVITSKYQDALPLHRLSHIFSRYKIDISRQTLSNWVLNTAARLKPVTEHLRQHIAKGDVVHIDETTVQVLKEDGKKPESKSYMWVQKGGPPDQSAVYFHYDRGRASTVPLALLDNFEGAIMTDGYAGYNALAKREGIEALCCMAHLRRKFIEARTAVSKGKKKKTSKADVAINLIAKLYAVEKSAKKLSAEDRYDMRQERSVPIIAKLKQWLTEISPAVLPKSKLGEAISYALKHFDRATKYVEDGRWPIDNNPAENAIRPFVIGRKNWLFSHSVKGAEASAALYSLIETSKLNLLEPFDYLRWLFTELPKGQRSLEELMPWSIDEETINIR